MGRMYGFLRGLDAWLERAEALDVCADAADEAQVMEREANDEPDGDASDAAYDRTQGYTQPDPTVAH